MVKKVETKPVKKGKAVKAETKPAKKGKVTKEIVLTEERIPALVITPKTAPVVSGNFQVVKDYLIGVRDRYKDIVFTTETLPMAEKIKVELRTYRTELTKLLENAKTSYFLNPKRVFEGEMNTLLAIIAQAEKKVDEALDREDQKRIDELNLVLDTYKKEFQKEYNLPEEYLARIEFKKQYFNKTQKEKDSKDDLANQFATLKKESDARLASLRLIKLSAKPEPRINVETYIEMFDHGEDVSVIVEKIEEEKQRLIRLDKNGGKDEVLELVEESTGHYGPGSGSDSKAETDDEMKGTDNTETPEQTEKLMIGKATGLNFETDFKDKTKTRIMEIKYPVDLSDSLTKLFMYLRTKGITTKFIESKPSY